MELQTISSLLKHNQSELHRQGVKSLAVFGSMARGHAVHGSDIDILVEFTRPIGLFEFIRLKLYLESVLGMPVDLVTSDALHPAMKTRILDEAIDVA